MPKKGYIRTEEHTLKIIEARSKNGNENKHCLKCGCFIGRKEHSCLSENPFKGKHHSEKNKEKIRLRNLGKHSSPNTEFKKGQPAWNKGKKCKYMKGNRFAVGNKTKTCFKSGHKSWLKGTKGLISHSLKWRKIMSDKMKGKNNHNWKGLTPIKNLLTENLEYKLWKEKVLERDNYTCQECFKKEIRLNVHHKDRSFSQLIQEFLQQYNQFSPIEDKETLVRLATTYQPFWDIDNGQTLCEDCHKETDNYLIYKGKII